MALLIVIVAIASLILITRPKNCNSDDICFNKAAAKCSIAKVVTFSNDNKYNYEILGKKKENCIIEATLLNLSNNQPKDLRDALNGRSMKCSIPVEILRNKPVKDIENLNDYCNGPLKEVILEITIEKMYDLIVRNLGKISTEIIDVRNITK